MARVRAFRDVKKSVFFLFEIKMSVLHPSSVVFLWRFHYIGYGSCVLEPLVYMSWWPLQCLTNIQAPSF